MNDQNRYNRNDCNRNLLLQLVLGTKRAANKISNTDVIVTGYTILNTGTDIVMTELSPWFAK